MSRTKSCWTAKHPTFWNTSYWLKTTGRGGPGEKLLVPPHTRSLKVAPRVASHPRLPDLITGVQKTAVCRKNGIRCEKPHGEFYYSVSLGAPRDVRPAGALHTNLVQANTHTPARVPCLGNTPYVQRNLASNIKRIPIIYVCKCS